MATRFTQNDLKRAVRGASDGGLRIGRIEIDPNGKIVIMSETATPKAAGSSWDDVLQ